MHPWLNWIEHLTTDEKVRGSNPLGCTPLENITLKYSPQEFNNSLDANISYLNQSSLQK